jgi:hypothetical protein
MTVSSCSQHIRSPTSRQDSLSSHFPVICTHCNSLSPKQTSLPYQPAKLFKQDNHIFLYELSLAVARKFTFPACSLYTQVKPCAVLLTECMAPRNCCQHCLSRMGSCVLSHLVLFTEDDPFHQWV